MSTTTAARFRINCRFYGPVLLVASAMAPSTAVACKCDSFEPALVVAAQDGVPDGVVSTEVTLSAYRDPSRRGSVYVDVVDYFDAEHINFDLVYAGMGQMDDAGLVDPSTQSFIGVLPFGIFLEAMTACGCGCPDRLNLIGAYELEEVRGTSLLPASLVLDRTTGTLSIASEVRRVVTLAYDACALTPGFGNCVL